MALLEQLFDLLLTSQQLDIAFTSTNISNGLKFIKFFTHENRYISYDLYGKLLQN
jgi:hypothetical protein